MAAAHGRPTLMQDVLAPLVEIERLQARVDDAVLSIQQLYDDTPLQNRPYDWPCIRAWCSLGMHIVNLNIRSCFTI